MSESSNFIFKFEKRINFASIDFFHKFKSIGIYRSILTKFGTNTPKANETNPRSLIRPTTITKGEVTIEIKLIVLSLKV